MSARLTDKRLLALAASVEELSGEWTLEQHLLAPDDAVMFEREPFVPQPAAVPHAIRDGVYVWRTSELMRRDRRDIVVTAITGFLPCVQAAYGCFVTIPCDSDEHAIRLGAETFARLCAEMGS